MFPLLRAVRRAEEIPGVFHREVCRKALLFAFQLLPEIIRQLAKLHRNVMPATCLPLPALRAGFVNISLAFQIVDPVVHSVHLNPRHDQRSGQKSSRSSCCHLCSPSFVFRFARTARIELANLPMGKIGSRLHPLCVRISKPAACSPGGGAATDAAYCFCA